MKPDDILIGDGRTATPDAARLSLRNPPERFPYHVEVRVSPVTNIIDCTWMRGIDDPAPYPAVKLTAEHEEKTVDTVTVTTAEAAKEVAKQWLCHAAKAHRFAQDTLEDLKSL